MSTLASAIGSSINNWWMFLLRAALLIILGIWMIANPGMGAAALAIYLGIMYMFTGIIQIVFSISNRKKLEDWGWYLLGGILDLVIGAYMLTHPGITVAVITILIGIMMAFLGGTLISKSLQLRNKDTEGWGYLLAFGILTVIAGLLILFNPFAGAATLITIIGISFLIGGVASIVLAMRLRKIKGTLKDFKEEVQEFRENL